MSQLWTITSIATGAVLHAAFETDSAGQHPKDKGWEWDAAKQKATRIDARPDLATQSWTGTAWVDDAVKVEAILIDQVKAEGERRRMLVLSQGGGKEMVYNAKLGEVEAFKGIASTVVGGTVAGVLAAIAALPATDRSRKFRYALAEMARRGEASIAPAIARFEAGADAAHVEAARIEAVEQAGVAAIKTATTAAAKRTAFAKIDWSWKPA